MSDYEGPFAAWLEDSDDDREELMRMAIRQLPEVPIHFSATVRGFWECLYNFHPRVLVTDVMLPEIPEVKRLSEGLAVAKWVRGGAIPQRQADALCISDGVRVLGQDFGDTPILLVTAREEEGLERELAEADVKAYRILKKGAENEETAGHAALRIIREAWESRERK